MVSHVRMALLCIDLHCFVLYCLVKQRHVGFATLHLGQFLWLRERRGKVSRVTVSGVWREKGKGVTCYGFWRIGGTRDMVSHVRIALLCIDLCCFAVHCLV